VAIDAAARHIAMGVRPRDFITLLARADEQCNERAPVHSITSSARSRIAVALGSKSANAAGRVTAGLVNLAFGEETGPNGRTMKGTSVALLVSMISLVGCAGSGELLFKNSIVVDHLDGNYQILVRCTYEHLVRQ